MKSKLIRTIKNRYFVYALFIKFKFFLTRFGGVRISNKGCARIKKSVVGNNNEILIEKESIVKSLNVFIRGNNNRIIIHENCRIGKNCSIRIEGNDCSVVIGEKTTITRDVHICVQENEMKIIIGEDCMFSNNITIRTSDSHPIFDINGVRINPAKPVVIGKHVWIAPHSTIMKGVSIGDGSIIGSNTLVTKNCEANSLYVGMPAKKIKENVKWTREELF